MLKHKEQIERLTPQEKIELLVGAHGHHEGQGAQTGLPMLSVAELWEGNLTEKGERLFPSAASLANSWNATLIADVAEHLAARGVKMGKNLFVLPDTKAACSVFGKELSEEPRLTADMVGHIAKTLSAAGVATCMHAPVPTMEDVELLHGEVDERMLYDRMASPFRTALAGTQCQAVLMPDEAAEQYSGIAAKIMKGAVPEGMIRICANVEHDHTTAALLENKLLLGASADALQAALENYNRIRRSVEEGGATVEELNNAVADGSAISEEALDAALDCRLSLCDLCLEHISGEKGERWQEQMEQTMESCALQAARESIVMLKNEKKALPLRPKSKLAFIGDIVFDNEESGFVGFRDKLLDELEGQKYKCVGFAQGYHLERERSEEMIPQAVELAKKADVAVVFLGMGNTREAALRSHRHLRLPANQLALFDALSRCGKPIIAVIVGSRLPDMFFDKWAKGVLMVPGEGIGVAKALCEVLSGRLNPMGRLAYSGYDFPDATFLETQRRIRQGKQKTGPFIGYRYAMSDGLEIKYPFGHGIGYTNVTYSALRFVGGKVCFTVQNHGKRSACEMVQVYMGKPDSAILRPSMELAAFRRIVLKGGERRMLEIPLKNLGVYMPDEDTLAIEDGVYHLWVGGSVGHTPLTARVQISGKSLAKQSFELSDYLHTVSNIKAERYTMEASCKPMKTKTILHKLGVLLILLSLFADVVYVTAGLLSFWDIGNQPSLFSMISAGCTALGVLLEIVYAIWHKIQSSVQKKREEHATKELFQDVEVVDASAIEELFVEEFDVPEEAARREVEQYTEKDEGLYAYMAVDTTLPALTAELMQFFEAHGLRISVKMARHILSSMLTSRLLVVRSDVEDEFERFVTLMGLFFGSESHLHTMQGRDDEGSLLYTYRDGRMTETPILYGLYAAQSASQKAHFMGLSGVRYHQMGHLLMPYIRYFSHPQNSYNVSELDTVVSLPANLWFVLGVADGESIEDMEPFVANFAAVIDLELEPCEFSEQPHQPEAPSCPQMEALVFRSKKATDIDEDLWKEVDRLESFVNERTPYHIGNKLFLQLERFLSVYIGCDGDMTSAMDSAVSAKLLPAILSDLKGNESMAEIDMLQVLESIFGEDNVMQCAHMLKHSITQIEGGEPTTEQAEEPVAEQAEELAAEQAEESAPEQAEELATEQAEEPTTEQAENVQGVQEDVE